MQKTFTTLALLAMTASGGLAMQPSYSTADRESTKMVVGGQAACVGTGSSVSVCGWTWCWNGGWNSNSGYAPAGMGNSSTTNLPCPCNQNTGTTALGPATTCVAGG